MKRSAVGIRCPGRRTITLALYRLRPSDLPGELLGLFLGSDIQLRLKQHHQPLVMPQCPFALLAFFSALGNEHYIETTQLFGGSYEVLRGWNPDLDPNDLPGLWRSACRHNGLQCLSRAEVVRAEQISPTDVRYTVRFLTLQGKPFVLGPCCGAKAEEMPPRSEFPVTVRRVGERYLVHDLPVYVP